MVISCDKTYTDNPFVDNVIYYAKLMAMNSVVKDEEEALANETAESLHAGEVLICCVEGRAVYGMFTSIPKEILENYIAVQSNLDLYANSNATLKNYLNSLTMIERTKLFNNLSALARTIYIDHYEIMSDYLNGLPDTWLDDYYDLYVSCVNTTADYKDLFEVMPEYTRYRILKTYLNNYDASNLSTIASSLEEFESYLAARTDTTADTELEYISAAMRSVFISHYEMMQEREYFTGSNWYDFICYPNTFERCQNGTVTYEELYNLFPEDALYDALVYCLGQEAVDTYGLSSSINMLETYFASYSSDPDAEQSTLVSYMSKVYMEQYNPFINYGIYTDCKEELIDYYGLFEYLPFETRKIILNAYIDEITNLEVYEDSKDMLDSYLNSLTAEERNAIRAAITKEMMVWYPEHYEEKNNYYRSYLGLPPLGENGEQYVDTLVHSWNETNSSFLEFGTKYTSMVPNTTYPDSHWRQEICEFDSYDVGILESEGVLDAWVSGCGSTLDSSRYRYIKYLGDSALDIYTCRKAMNFQLMGVPTLDDTDAQRRYIDVYNVNRDFVIRTVFSDAYKFQSDYYNKFMIVFIIVNTIMDMLTDIPELIIHREVFDSRCIKYLFESYGIPYYSEIPLKYQRAMLKNLNILIKYKSSTRNMIDICNLFGFSDVKVFNYYLFRQRNVDSNTGEYLFADSGLASYSLDMFYVRDENGAYEDWNGIHYIKMLDYQKYDEDEYTHLITVTDDSGNTTEVRVINQDADVYIYDEANNDFIPFSDVDYFNKIKANTSEATLKFIKVPEYELITEYKNDPDYIINYDEIVYQDEGNTWDGGLDHDQLYQDLLDYEFNAVITKYISVETITEMTELSFQVAYFYNMLFDNMYSEDALTVDIPHIKIGHSFRFMDVLCYLFALMYLYNDLEDNIMYSPTQILYVKGYNFNEAINLVLQDETCFSQTDSDGNPLEDYEKENIFDINERIEEDGYNYRAAFEPYWIRAFNLEADIDALETWLQDNYQMSLDDFIVDDTLTDFDSIITLRSFFSLNNSYYQKSIFQDGVVPLQYNQNIKYAYDYLLYSYTTFTDASGNEHACVVEDGKYMYVINDTSDTIYVLDFEQYIIIRNVVYAVYAQYTKNEDGSYSQSDFMYYYLNDSGGYTHIFDGDIGIVNKYGDYIFAADAYYYKTEDGEYEEITEERFYAQDPYYEDRKILNFGEYYILVDGNYVLDPDNTYVIVTRGNETYYVLATDTGDYTNLTVSEENLYVLHESGHFVKLVETDYYTIKDDGSYEYNEEECYVITSQETEYCDETVSPRVYYKKLADYYSETNWIIYADDYYVKDGAGNYISVDDIMDPNNTYFFNGDGYSLVMSFMGTYYDYSETLNVSYILVLQDSNDYSRLELADTTYVDASDDVNWYVLNSDSDFVLVLLTDKTYADTSLMIVVLNKAVSGSNDLEDDEDSKYDPEKTDNVWDENDWYYTKESYDPDNVLTMNGENKWYYKKGDAGDEDEYESEPVGTGFYMESTAYIGSVTLEEGSKYYMAFDVETNFTGNLQIYCTADDSVAATTDRTYHVIYGESTHVAQTFTANSDSTPEIRFLIYDYEEYPVHPGDYIVVSNIRFVKSYNDNFIAQDIPSYDKLQELYRTNEAIYNYLVDLMANCTDYYKYRIYKYLYDSLMLSKYNKEAFKTGENTYAKTYTDFLKSRDAILYERLVYYKTLDEDTMHKEVADDIIEICYAIDDCVDTYTYGYLYSYFPAVSASYIQEYIIKIINFFKSWKVHLLGINTVYKFDDPNENTIRALEGQQYRTRMDFIKGNVHVHDTIKVNPLDDTNCSGESYSDLYDDLVEYSNEYSDYCMIRDRVRVISRIGNSIKFSDNYENIHLILNSDEPIVKAEDGELTITSSEVGFSTVNENEMLISTDETDEEAFASQILNEINLFSGDYIEFDDDDEEVY